MADSGWMNKVGATPGKLGVVAVLATVLMVVLVFQVSSSGTPTTASQERAAGRRKPPLRVPPQPTAPAAQADQPSAEKPSWPPITLEEAIQHDPFAVAKKPAAAAPPKPAQPVKADTHPRQTEERKLRTKQALENLRGKGVKMVLLDGSERVAIVGDRSIRVGDVLDGLRVVSITLRGITLAEHDGKN
jgi:hypothetical protein